MKRRHFLTATGAAASTALMASPAVLAQNRERVRWVGVSAFGASGLLGRAFDAFAEYVATASGGRLTIQTYHAGELVAPFEALDAVQNGTAQMGFGAPYYWAGKSDSISFVAAMPFGLTAQEQNAWCYYGGGIELADRLCYNPLDLKFLPLGNTGNQMGGWYRREINTVADLEGLKFRMPGLGGEILASFGVNVVLLPGSEVLVALTSGAIDGTEWIGPAADLGAGLYQAANYYYSPGWHEPGTILDSFYSLEAWNALDDELKGIVERAAAATNLYVLSEFQASNNDALEKLTGEHGVSLRTYSEELLTAFGQRAAEMMPEIAGRSPEGVELYNHIIDFRTKVATWSSVSEGAFLQARGAASFQPI